MIATRVWAVLAAAVFVGGTVSAAEAAAPESYHVGYRLVHVPRAGQEPLSVCVWYPTEAGPGRMLYPLPVRPLESEATQDAAPAAGPFPLVIYSHGGGGCGIMGATYAEPLAEAGFVVAAPDHGDEFQVCSSDGKVTADRQRALQWVQWARGGSRNRYEGRPSFKSSHRPPEIRATIDYLLEQSAEADPELRGLVDADHIGIMGVSFGAWTTQTMAGFYNIFRDDRIKAALPLAGTPVPAPGSFANIHVPVMMIFGEKERMALLDSTTPLKTAGMVRDFGTANAPRYLAGVRGVDHLDFGPTGVLGARPAGPTVSMDEVRRDDPCARTVNHYALAFFSRYLKDERSAQSALTAPTADVFVFRADTGDGKVVSEPPQAPGGGTR